VAVQGAEAEHFVANAPAGDPGPDLIDDACVFVSRNPRERVGHARGPPPRAQEGVERLHPGYPDSDPNLPGLRVRVGQVDPLQHIRWTVAAERNGFHTAMVQVEVGFRSTTQ